MNKKRPGMICLLKSKKNQIAGNTSRNGLAAFNGNQGMGATEWEEFVELHLSHLAYTPGGKLRFTLEGVDSPHRTETMI